MSQEGNSKAVRNTIEWIDENVDNPDTTTVSCACFQLGGGAVIMCGQCLLMDQGVIVEDDNTVAYLRSQLLLLAA